LIAALLGHESIDTTQIYLHAHLARKEAALAKLKPYERRKRVRFKPSDRLLAFLEALQDVRVCRMEAGRRSFDQRQIRENAVSSRNHSA
jgi:hypothetical protein